MNSGQPQLRTLFWEATLRCNAGCPFCGSRCGAQAAEEIGGEDVLRVFRRVAAAYDPRKIMVNVTGGEPLLREDLFSVMERVHEMGFPWGMVTNGSLITDETIGKMRRSGMRTVCVSIDDLFERHEQLRRLPGAFSRIISAIRKMDAAGFLDSIQITTVATKQNLDSLEQMLDYFSTLPVDSWRLTPVDPIGRGKDQKQLLLDSADLKRLLDFMDRHAFHTKPLLTLSCSHFCEDKDTLYRTHGFRCDAGKHTASILADGSIFACPNVPRREELIQGNICRDDFVQVWETGFLPFRDDGRRKLGDCTRCDLWERCRGDSLHTWNFETQTPAFCIAKLAGKRSSGAAPSAAAITSLKQRFPTLQGLRIGYGSSSTKTVVFTPYAAEALFLYFHWGQRHPLNLCEQMAAVVGHRDGEQAWVEELIPVPLNDRAEQTASFDGRLYQFIREEIALMNRNLPSSDPQLFGGSAPYHLLGLIHSHPGGLDAAMSIPDIKLHEAIREHTEDFFTGIIQPQKRDLCIYWNSVYSPVRVELLSEAALLNRWEL